MSGVRFFLLLADNNVQSLKSSTLPLGRWVNSERTLKERWAPSERTVSASCTKFSELLWTVRERKVNGERTVNNMWTHDERFILSASGVILTTVSSVIRKKNKLHTCIVISQNIILFDWMISERWTNNERKVNANGNENASQRTVNAL